jgi:hypothetical protein
MRFTRTLFAILALGLCAWSMAPGLRAQNAGNSTSVGGTVTDPSGAVIPGATVTIHNPVSGFERAATTDASGDFSIQNVPFNPYHMTVTAAGFAAYVQDIDVRSSVPISVKVGLQLAGTTSTVTVEAGGDLIENDSTFHTDVDRALFDKLPLESASSSVSSLVTLSSPGVAADSNGLFHGLGDHAENSFSVDGQPITDQQSKVFSNQIPVDAIQSMEVISGAPPAEYGDKTSLVIDVTTRSGQGVTPPHGTITADYGSFGTVNGGFNLAYGGQKWGNFISASGLNSGRFLDPPEFAVTHDKGNEENLFDRVDYQLSTADSVHLNFGYTRSWFQTPNSFDSQLHPGFVNGLTGGALGPADQRSQIQTYNVAPTWTRLVSSTTVLTAGAFVRQDQYHYYPSADPFADLGPIQLNTVAQNRTLTNAGIRADLSRVKGIHNLKAGIVYEQTFLTEGDHLSIVDFTLNPPCFAANANPVPWFDNPGLNDPSNCASATSLNPSVYPTPFTPNTTGFVPLLGCFDLTRPTPSPADACAGSSSGNFLFHGHTDVKELALYVQDTITKGNWNFNVGIRGDLYNGLTRKGEAEPRLGIAYNIKPSSTVLRISYARTLETPFNENLVVASTGCSNPVIAALLSCASTTPTPLTPGFRNEFHAGLQQAFGRYFVVDAEYIWKYTHSAYDFSILGNTPITFPIEWHGSKIPGYAIRASVPDFHGFTALVVMSSVAARFFNPQVSGIGATPGVPVVGVFRIDHDEKFNETTHLQYQPWQRGPWVGFNWRYDSGLVAASTPCVGGTAVCSAFTTTLGGAPAVDLSGLTADQEFEAGLFCGTIHATPTQALPTPCLASQYGSTLITIPATGKSDDDKNPPRIQPRSLFDLAVGDDNLFHGDRYKWSVRLTVINLTNKYALYNFLSTFSGTHYVTPRAIKGEVGFHF